MECSLKRVCPRWKDAGIAKSFNDWDVYRGVRFGGEHKLILCLFYACNTVSDDSEKDHGELLTNVQTP